MGDELMSNLANPRTLVFCLVPVVEQTLKSTDAAFSLAVNTFPTAARTIIRRAATPVSLVVVDVPASPSPCSLISPRQPHQQTAWYSWDETLDPV